MSVAQTKAARRLFKSYYRGDNPIGTPRYKRKSTEAIDRQRARVIATQKAIQARKGAKK